MTWTLRLSQGIHMRVYMHTGEGAASPPGCIVFNKNIGRDQEGCLMFRKCSKWSSLFLQTAPGLIFLYSHMVIFMKTNTKKNIHEKVNITADSPPQDHDLDPSGDSSSKHLSHYPSVIRYTWAVQCGNQLPPVDLEPLKCG